MTYTVLGISASLRNARRGTGNQTLISELMALNDEAELLTFLNEQAQVHLNQFIDAGRKEQIPFDQMYRNLRKLKGKRGLSNSEVMLAAALWSAKEIGGMIDHLSLSEYFLETSKRNNIEELIQRVNNADAIILSSPVYFGDRGSLSQSFINFLRSNAEQFPGLDKKIYAGLAVGAKRNGGQETTLIYQLVDMVNLGMLGVGNDSETTSQYGGTGLAGDVGTMPQDEYGLKTAMGTGRRISRVTRMFTEAIHHNLVGKHRIAFWLLQDQQGIARKTIEDLIASYPDTMEADIIDFTDKEIVRCLACDICPTHIDIDQEYRCIIKGNRDHLKDMHEDLLDADAIVPVAYSPKNRAGLITNYQRFIERTRYFRRGDYVFSDLLTAPLIIDEIGANENLHIRMVTSMIRHHTIVLNPMVLFRYQDKIVNWEDVKNQFKTFNQKVRELTKARLLAYSRGVNHLRYNPVGYVLSASKDLEDQKLMKRIKMIEKRIDLARDDCENRVEVQSSTE
ncbi:MAG: NAD(P)H-dependent oxidoreductase [Pseudomonadales bacterium]|nr:NAD(P)H-dependent oxidoreductase [Pseudomonadales bacterium]